MSAAVGARLEAAPAAPPAHRAAPPAGSIDLYWLGQAGFLIEAPSARILIDPYLSDSLAAKYRGTAKPHVRMSPAPIAPDALRDVDFVIATHGHTDHLDPGTLAPIAAGNPDCRFVVPGSCAEAAVARGVPPGRLVTAEAFAELALRGITLRPLPSAHEELAIDGSGRLLALGYLIEAEGLRLYHSGDCAPYPGLAGNLRPYPVDLALLPVNGRDAARLAAGIVGNFSLEEAVALAEELGFGATIGHHFGMFDFNTIDPPAAAAFLVSRAGGAPFELVAPGLRYRLSVTGGRKGA